MSLAARGAGDWRGSAHPNVVAVHDVGDVRRRRDVFIAMEFVEGVTLRELARRAPRSAARDPRRVLAAAGAGLAAAHAPGSCTATSSPTTCSSATTAACASLDFGLARARRRDGRRSRPTPISSRSSRPTPTSLDQDRSRPPSRQPHRARRSRRTDHADRRDPSARRATWRPSSIAARGRRARRPVQLLRVAVQVPLSLVALRRRQGRRATAAR